MFAASGALLKNENIIFNISNEADFTALALEVFRLQHAQNLVYRKWCEAMKVKVSEVRQLTQIPFLPIEFFKHETITCAPPDENTVIFTSSGTTSQITSKHLVNKISLYEKSFSTAFELFYGDPSQYCILALLPNYLQRTGSSLVYMCDQLIKNTNHPDSGFFLDEQQKLSEVITKLKKQKQKTLLIGVSYALMDLCDAGIILDDNFIVMETGGMKGRRKELLKPELHAYLKNGFKINDIHSEYGMTELLSQAYSTGEGLFKAPPWLKFMTREVNDPLSIRNDGRTGGINVIDLANLYSCSFIATKDLGRIHQNGKLELMGRYEDSDVRGCNLMLEAFT